MEGITPTEGLKLLIAEVAGIGNGLCVGGEGRNEITIDRACEFCHNIDRIERPVIMLTVTPHRLLG